MKGLWLWLLASGNFRLADKEAAVQDDRTVGTGVWHENCAGANVGGIVSQSKFNLRGISLHRPPVYMFAKVTLHPGASKDNLLERAREPAGCKGERPSGKMQQRSRFKKGPSPEGIRHMTLSVGFWDSGS